ncbi:MAG: translation initiation factor IF-2 [Verrucomicrobiota bacterium]
MSESVTPKKAKTPSRKKNSDATGVDKPKKASAPKKTSTKKESKAKTSTAAPRTVKEAVSPSSMVLLQPVEAPTVASVDDKNISMKPPVIVKDLATRLNCKAFQLIHELMEVNIFATLNQSIEEEVARKICEKRGFTFNVEKREKGAGVHKPEPVVEPPKPPPIQSEHLKTRPPVVTFMGHVDHGKTSLLDAIRQTRVAAGEAGGITQHIGAYTVNHKNHPITFLDTPGHEAFTSMRARGANITDIAVIVIAADDGIMPQTIEAIRHAQAAKVTTMVAINKIDMPGANIDRVKGQLQEKGLTPEDWGGETICCPVSATKKTGIDKLLEMILLQAEILELKAEPVGKARGTIIESQMEQGRGATATVLVRQGTLCVGDSFICGQYWGKVKALVNDRGQNFKEAGPSVPAKIVGFSGAPLPGEEFMVMESEREARQIAEEKAESLRLGKLNEVSAPVTLENLFTSMSEGQKKVLNLVVKTDVQGSLEAIVDSLKKLPSDKIDLNVIFAGVGPIAESDVLLSKASNAVVIGFNTKTDNAAANAAKREHVQIKLYSIIYELIDQIKEAMAGLLDPITRETVIGTAVVKKVFELSKFPVAGCMVQTGRIARNGRARVLRKKQPIYDGAVVALKRFQDDAAEVRAGLECGIRLGNFNEYEEDDLIECYLLEKIPQSL